MDIPWPQIIKNVKKTRKERTQNIAKRSRHCRRSQCGLASLRSRSGPRVLSSHELIQRNFLLSLHVPWRTDILETTFKLLRLVVPFMAIINRAGAGYLPGSDGELDFNSESGGELDVKRDSGGAEQDKTIWQ